MSYEYGYGEKTPLQYEKEFILVNSAASAIALSLITLVTFALTFVALPAGQFTVHFFQAGIFTAGFLFGPVAGAAVGALASSYIGLVILHNPYIVLGNAILGFFAAHFYKKHGPAKAALAAYAIQLPYLFATDVLLMGMPLATVATIAVAIFAENVICALAAGLAAPGIRNILFEV